MLFGKALPLIFTAVSLFAVVPGERDITFQANLPDSVHGISPQQDGKILIHGIQIISGSTYGVMRRLHPDGSVDTSFAPDITLHGRMTPTLQPDGKILISGYFSAVDGQPRYGIARLTPDGRPDPSFDAGLWGPTNRVNNPPAPPDMPGFSSGVAGLYSDGKILLEQSGLQKDGNALPLLICLGPDGTLDTTFNFQGNYLHRVWVVKDDKFFALQAREGASGLELVLFNRDGTYDRSFKPINSFSYINSLIQLPDGSILCAGVFTLPSPKPVVKFSGQGTLDESFNFSYPGEVHALLLDAYHHLYALGSFRLLDSATASISLARFDPSGEWDTSFKPVEGGPYFGMSMAQQADGKILVGGDGRVGNGIILDRLVRFHGEKPGSAGALYFPRLTAECQESAAATVTIRRTSGFGQAASVTYSTVTETASAAHDFIPSSGTIQFAPGEVEKELTLALIDDEFIEPFESFSLTLSTPSPNATLTWTNSIKVHIIDNDGPSSLLANFKITANPNATIRQALLQPDGKLIVAGEFTQIHQASLPGLARLNPDGSLDRTFTPPPATPYYPAIALQPGGKIIVTGFHLPGTPYHRTGIFRLNPDGSLDTTFQPGTGFLHGDTVDAGQIILPDTNGRFLIFGLFRKYNSVDRPGGVRLHSDGTLDLTFAPSVPLYTLTALRQSSGRLVVNTYDRLVRLHGDGALDPSFSGPAFLVQASAALEDDKILVGRQYGWPETPCILRLQADGSIDRSFTADLSRFPGNLSCISLAVQQNRKVLALFEPPNSYSVYLVRMMPDGALDSSFEPLIFQTPLPSQRWVRMQLLPSGQILVAGLFHRVNDVPYKHLILLKGGEENATRLLRMHSLEIPPDRLPRLSISVPPLKDYLLEASDDLRSWIPISTNSALNGNLEIIDKLISAQRFYRAKEIPQP